MHATCAAKRDAGDGQSLFDFNVQLQDKAMEFVHTPFANSYLKYRHTMSFWHKNTEYKVGDFVKVLSNPGRLYRIDKVKVSPIHVEQITPEFCVPVQHVECTEFLTVQDLYELHEAGIDDALPGEVVEIDDGMAMDLPVREVKKKIEVRYNVDAWDARSNEEEEEEEESASAHICRYVFKVNERQLRPAEPVVVSLLPTAIQRGKRPIV